MRKARDVRRALLGKGAPILNVKDGTEITCAWTQRYKEPWCEAHPLRTYDEGWGPLWIFGDEIGPFQLVRSPKQEDAYDIMLDEQNPIPLNEVPEAYGFETQEELNAAVRAADEAGVGWPELIDGYEHQPNGSGSGIVSVSYNLWMHEMTADDLERFNIGLRIEVIE